MQRYVEVVKKQVRAFIGRVARRLDIISRGRITPNSVTWFGFAMHLPIAFLIGQGHLVWAGILLIIFGLFDSLDGELARLQKRVTNTGGFLDATTDRFKEVLLYSGCAYLFVQGHQPKYAVVAVFACGASICISYIKAKGEAVVSSLNHKMTYPELNHLFSGGLFPFEVRMTVLIVGLLSNQVVLAVSTIAVLASIAAVRRLIVISRKLA